MTRKHARPRVLITAGPTREYIDPVRFISNASSGLMGYMIAGAAAASGAKVTLISGPVCIKPPQKVKIYYVGTAKQMSAAVERLIESHDVFISAAAVSDWRPAKFSKEKIKKDARGLNVKLVSNPDILKEVAGRYSLKKVFAGFALETGNILNNARRKLEEKKLDIIVANPPGNISSASASGTILVAGGRMKKIKRVSKKRFAAVVWKEVEKIYDGRQE
jgi:phosphopantothenoylcysteine decarboxylase/phosphopantothenate--cysteine ligase